MSNNEETEQDSAESSEDDSGQDTASSSDTVSDSEDDGSSVGEDEDPEDNTIDVTLEFFDPKETDFHGLKALLQSFLDGENYASSELVDTIIKQSTVGTIVKSGDHGDPVGVLTVLNTNRYKSLKFMLDIKAYLLKHCKLPSTKQDLETLWARADTGMLISERLVNCPPQLAPPLHQALFEEVAWATEDEPSQELRDCFKLKNYITISRAFTDPFSSLEKTTKKQKKQKVEELIVYARPEDEFFHKHCKDSFTFSTGRATGKDELEPLRLVMTLTAEQIEAARKELDDVVGNLATADS